MEIVSRVHANNLVKWAKNKPNVLVLSADLTSSTHTFAVFIYRRAYDQIAMSIAYPNLPVRMFGFLPGITTPGGAGRDSFA